MNRLALVSLGLVMAAATQASADLVSFSLSNHPDGNVAPPLYGMRFDNLLGAGSTTFSFAQNPVTLVVDTTAASIRIMGRVVGGIDTGSSIPVLRTFDLDFTYRANVTGNITTGWLVTGSNSNNSGTLTEVGASNVFAFSDMTGNPSSLGSFQFAPDGHRLSGASHAHDWVGRGWFNAMNGTVTQNGTGLNGISGGSHDFLFVGTPTPTLIPLPAGAWMGMAGLGGFGLITIARRRDRKSN